MEEIEKDIADIEWEYIQSLVKEIDRKASRHVGVNIFVAIVYV